MAGYFEMYIVGIGVFCVEYVYEVFEFVEDFVEFMCFVIIVCFYGIVVYWVG